jgi:hypothetical protein
MEESYLFTYANGCIYKLGLFGERVVNGDLCRLDAAVTKNGYMQVERIWFLKRERMLPTNIVDILFVIRKRRNGAVHAEMDTHHNFIVWSGMNIYFDYNGQNSQYSVERILVKCPNQ